MKVLITGGNSDIISGIVSHYLNQGHEMHLASRDLVALKTKFGEPHEKLHYYQFLADNPEKVAEFIGLIDFTPDLLIIGHGYLGDNVFALFETREFRRIQEVNYLSSVHICQAFAEKMNAIEGSMIVGISSVAGDRGRKKVGAYGAAKAGFTVFLSALRSEYNDQNLHVMTIKPGIVQTKMTRGVAKIKLLTSTPEKVSKHIIRGIKKRRNILYTPGYWKWIMYIIRQLPEFIFKRTSF